MSSYTCSNIQSAFNSFNFTGNESTLIEDDIDYYASYSYPNFAVVEAYSTHFSLNISIVQDCKLERTELFRVTAFPPQLPFGHVQCTTDVLIGDSYCKFKTYR